MILSFKSGWVKIGRKEQIFSHPWIISIGAVPFVMIKTVFHEKSNYPSNQPFYNCSAICWISYSELQFDGRQNQLIDGATSVFTWSRFRLNRLQLLLDQERPLMLHWQLQNPSTSFPLHLLQMGNALWCLWEGGRGFPPSASWTGRTTPSRLPPLLPRWRMTSLFLSWVV